MKWHPYTGEEIDREPRQSDERTVKAEKYGPYIIRDRITIKVDEMARAVDISVWRKLAANFVFWFVDRFKKITMQIVLVLYWEVTA